MNIKELLEKLKKSNPKFKDMDLSDPTYEDGDWNLLKNICKEYDKNNKLVLNESNTYTKKSHL